MNFIACSIRIKSKSRWRKAFACLASLSLFTNCTISTINNTNKTANSEPLFIKIKLPNKTKTIATFNPSTDSIGFVSDITSNDGLAFIKKLEKSFQVAGFNICNQNDYYEKNATHCNIILKLQSVKSSAPVGMTNSGVNLATNSTVSLSYDLYYLYDYKNISGDGKVTKERIQHLLASDNMNGSILVDFPATASPYLNYSTGQSSYQFISDALADQIFYSIISSVNKYKIKPEFQEEIKDKEIEEENDEI